MYEVRKVHLMLKSRLTLEGAGVRLKSVFGYDNPWLDPFLLLDDFHYDNPEDFNFRKTNTGASILAKSDFNEYQ